MFLHVAYMIILTMLLACTSRTCHAFRKVSTTSALLKSSTAPGLSNTKRYLTTNILIVGKRNGGEDWIADGCAEYEKRLSVTMSLSTTFCKSDDDLVKHAKAAKGTIFAMDEHGKQHTSIDFSKILYKGFEDGGAHVTFIVGGFAGLPEDIKKSHQLISLSKMTWTHQMARLLLLEQIYRATEIHKGSGYHKE